MDNSRIAAYFELSKMTNSPSAGTSPSGISAICKPQWCRRSTPEVDYGEAMTGESNSEWIAVTGLWPVHADVSDATIPDHILADPNLSLMAKGLFALLVAEQGRPVNPCDDAYESPEDIANAIDELVAAGLAVRIEK